MQPSNRDAGYLWDMLQAAHRIQTFTAGMSNDNYLTNVLVQSAVERQFEILGEAARRISQGFQNTHPAIPWSGIIGQRNIIAHQYDDLIQEQLWLAVTADIPVLIAYLEALIPSLPPEIG